MALPATELSLEGIARSLSDYLQMPSQKAIHQISDIAVHANCSKVILVGEANSYYCKQMAQELARKFLTNRTSIVNKIIVKKPEDSLVLS